MIRIALIGCGQIGRVHAARLQADPRAELVVLCDPSVVAATRLRDEFAPQARVETSFEHLLAASDLDAVVLCTPTGMHFDQVRACRARGWQVLCEKPLADTRERILTLIEESQSGPALTLAYQRRSSALFRTIRREISSGRHGPLKGIVNLNAEHWQQVQCQPGMWRDDPAMNPGGFIGDAGSHRFDIVFYLSGRAPQSVFAQSDNCGSRVPISTQLVARLEGGVPVTMTFTGNAHLFREGWQITCAEGEFLIQNDTLTYARQDQLRPWTDLEPHSSPVESFLDQLTQGAENVAPAACALAVFDMTRAALESARSGTTVTFPTKGG